MVREKELNWMSSHRKEVEKYAGKWIAVLDNKILASGNSVKEVVALAKKKAARKLPLVTKVPRKDEEMYVL